MIAAADCPALKNTRSHRLEIINVHLSPPHKPRHMAERVRQVPTLCRYLSQAPEPQCLVAGDLNTFDPMPAYFQLRGYLDDAIADCANAHGRKLAPTWGPQPAGLRMLRIDHIFSRGLSAQHYEVLRVSGSDHSALIADLQLDAAQ